MQADQERRISLHKPVLVVTTRFVDGIEARIDRDYDARRNPREGPFTRDELLEASAGADALFITPLDRFRRRLLPAGGRLHEGYRDLLGRY